MLYVVGSGLAGVACAYALVKKGEEVTMLDAGIDLEPETKKIVAKLRESKKWDPLLIQKIKGEFQTESEHGQREAPVRFIYGSDYPYRDIEKHIPLKFKDVSIQPSFAKGGLSAVWGASFMPYLQQDINDWPVTIKDLEPHYRAVLEFMPVAGAKDDLSKLFPMYTDNYQNFKFSRQAASLLKDMNHYKKELNKEGFIFGSSRLAVQFEDSEKKKGCVYCGLCMFGCPYGLIYNSADTVDELKKYRNFHYVKDTIAKKVVESGNTVRIIAEDRLSGKEKIYFGSRVFLGCGVLPSTKIILESMGAYDEEITIKDSQILLLPFLRYKSVPNVKNERLHTLSQIFIEIFDKDLDRHSIHIQLSTYNELFETMIKKQLGFIYTPLKKPMELFLERFILMLGFLHSDSSSGISVKLKKNNKLILAKKENKIVKKKISALIKKFFKNRKYFRMVPLVPLMKVAKPGVSNHYGGSFPMKKNPKKFESDILGRPYGFKRTHMVDASVFTSLSTQTVAFTMMANAHRIASTYDREL